MRNLAFGQNLDALSVPGCANACQTLIQSDISRFLEVVYLTPGLWIPASKIRPRSLAKPVKLFALLAICANSA